MNKKYGILIRILEKYLKKGNVGRCLRDILPYSNLDLRERAEISRIIHKIVRYRRLYEYLLKIVGIEPSAKSLVDLALGFIRVSIMEPPSRCIKLSYSDYLCGILSEELLRYLNIEPKNYLAVNISRISRNEIVSALSEEGFWGRIYDGVESCVEIPSEARYSRVIKNGLAHVQDPSSQILSKFVSTLGEEILDYCAGSGGKSLTIKYYDQNVKLYAYDISKYRIESLKRRIAIYNLDIEILRWPSGQYEVVMIDAPCSGVGAARRNPEAKYICRKNAVAFYQKQVRILRTASKAAKNYIVYVVCTLTPDETDNVIKTFLSVTNDKYRIVEVPIVSEKTFYGGFIKLHDILYVSVLEKVSTK